MKEHRDKSRFLIAFIVLIIKKTVQASGSKDGGFQVRKLKGFQAIIWLKSPGLWLYPEAWGPGG